MSYKNPYVDLSEFSKYENVDNWEVYRFEQIHVIRSRLSGRKLREFNITADDLVYPNFCPILNIPITRKLSRDNFPSVDRVDNSKGYVKGNVRVISHKANRMKQDNTVETLEKLLQYLRGEL